MKSLEHLNFYELLNLNQGDGPAEIETAFRRAMETYGKQSLAVYSVLSDEERERLLSRIRQAYAVLIDEERRSRYNRQLAVS